MHADTLYSSSMHAFLAYNNHHIDECFIVLQDDLTACYHISGRAGPSSPPVVVASISISSSSKV